MSNMESPEGPFSVPMLGCTMLVCLFSLKKLVSWTSSYFTTQHFNEVREKKIAAIKSSNTKWAALVVTKISPQDASKITELSFEDLCRVLQSGEVSATQALQAYQYKAVKENAKHNFICEAVAEAEGIAAKLDALTAEERRSLPLFGVPISLKETYMLEGYDCTVGCVKLINKPMKETSSIVKMLVTQGAVPFIRTNIPQTCMSFDSVNPIYGTTSNPHDPLRSCGGSSGGEGAAIGACSSILGLGTDIGGSIRIPAAFCGIYSLKPTAGRLSFHSDVGVDYNGRIVTVTCGPMGRDVNSLIAAMKVLSMPESHLVDPFVPPIPFNEKELNSNKKLRVGCFFGFEPIEVCESSKRAVAMAEEALKKAGHEVVHWQPPNTMWALSQAYATNVFGDGGKVFVEAVQNDIWEDHIKDIIYLSMMPAWLKKFIASTIAPLIFPRYLINYLTSSSGSGTISNLWKDEAEIKEYRRMVVKEMEKQEIDAILCPSMPVPAMRIGECKDAVGVVVYTALFNVLNFPSGAVPITKVTTEDIEKDMVNFPTKDMWHKAIKKNLEGSKGLPVGVQCASLPFYEERCLRMMKDLEKQIGYDVLIEYQN